MPRLLFLFLVIGTHIAHAQTGLGKLSVEKIMRDPKWIGTSPSGMRWSADGQYLFFNWNPTAAPADSVYYISTKDHTPQKATYAFAQETVMANSIVYNDKKKACVYVKNSDIYYKEIKSGKTKRIVNTAEFEYNPQFAFNDQKIIYTRSQNLYAWDITSGETEQLTRIHAGGNSRTGGRDRNDDNNEQEKWLRKDQLANFEILKQRRERKEARDDYNKAVKEKEMRSIGIDDKNMQSLALSPDGRFVSYRLYKSAGGNKGTLIPDYVTESGFTTDLPGRTKVGEQPGSFEFFIYDRTTDSLYNLSTDTLPGIKDLPDYVKDYPEQLTELTKKPMKRPVNWSAVGWSPDGSYLLLDIQSQDNKDRWLAVWDATSLSLHAVERERNEAWVGGPGFYNRGWLNNETIWFQSEASGYSHLYTLDIKTGNKKQLTSGNYEVQDAGLSADKKYFYLTTNEVHPGEKHFYRLPVTGGKAEKLTSLTGSNQVLLSPDEKTMAIIYSYSNKPAELYWQETKATAKMEQVTDKAQTPEFKSYNWRDPEVINFKARDGATVYARLYRTANPDPTKPAVIFVHGAGYLQNAHKWWSSYFREYMFHNMLADKGYTVMDIDYRGSAGYGRDWRTGIYRFMGGKDLTDHVDAADWLVKNAGVSKDRIGIYGGSYGGFITLMAMFTTPDVFAAGAALRPVTDWAQYNHGYTSNILNEPANDSIAYRRSSPFYYANGLKGNLLICHGMVDVNVHYQDAVKLSQRLIELGKDNWELASYPMEDHGFIEPSSWTDEYKRIFKLFETVLKER
jgi:dipeptidyl aminopeptidase/acylaminoacyl peptidase